MTDQEPRADLPSAEVAGAPEPKPRRRPRTPGETLVSAMVIYIAINLLFALPLTVLPEGFFEAIGLPSATSSDLGGLRWVGGVLLAWAISGFLVLARPGGRAIFVTTGALQLTLAALAFLYSWSLGEYEWSLWYQIAATMVLAVGAGYMWWARLRARAIFRGEAPAR